ncbi:MAG: SAM-dependent methyltransferase [Caldimonas sp.]
MSPRPGTLFLVPNTLDFGVADASADLDELLPRSAIRIAARLDHWLCENAKTTRAFLKRVDAVVALAQPLQTLTIVELPRPAKGRAPDRPAPVDALLAPALAGFDMGLLSEAGLPAVADPGAAVVAAAHAAKVPVVVLPGASSIVLALAASGLEGQSFAFVGYVPVAADARAARLRELEAISRRHRQTQLMIETPYRNAALLDALLAHLQPATRLSVSVGLTVAAGFTRTDSVAGWRRAATALPADLPAMFAILGSG